MFKSTHFKRDFNRWSIFLLAIVFFIALPIIAIFIKLFGGPGETWSHLVRNVLTSYISNSLYLIIVCGILTVLFGVSSAWFVSRYKFPFQKYLEWLLILPLAIPSYITAYAFAGLFDYGGSLELLFKQIAIQIPKLDIMNIHGLALILSVSLYPYVYVASRAFFLHQSANLIEVSKLLGVGEFKTFFKLLLPMARPAIVGGLVLVLMEVLNDYGAAKYFGVSTFTTGIFRSWFALEEPETAVYLAALLVAIIFGLLLLEKYQRRKISYSNSVKSERKQQKIALSNSQKWLVFSWVSIPVILGFILPVLQLIYWATLTYKEVFTSDFFTIAMQSLGIAILAAIGTVFVAICLIYFTKWNRIPFIGNLSKISVLGYAIPGAVIAVGVMIPTLTLDKWMIGVAKNFTSESIGLIINGSIIGLTYAYIVRFLAVAYNPIEATSLKIGNALPESSKMLGIGNIRTFFKIEFPLLKKGILSAMLLVFVDVMKELPLTLILKPYNVQTLAVKAYEFASDELIMEASIPSLFIIFTGILPVIFLNKLIID
ncbi:ABC transporter permease [Aureivirga marina]|uniref:ABC transporter permease n=1 Tax=Aureivirga marina TaxID=1182451 RepID=UPI00293D2F12|nr:iron ABC transporter permease [Aureivirga marina]